MGNLAKLNIEGKFAHANDLCQNEQIDNRKISKQDFFSLVIKGDE